MRILVSNDDGIYSPGIAALAEVAAEFGTVRIVAPDVERSSSGHAITSSFPLAYRPTKVGNFLAFRVNGTPADCVGIGIHQWEKVDLVLSGVNLGFNLGNSIWHSGTLAAAKQAVLLGLRGIALSAPSGMDQECERYKPWIRRVLDILLEEHLSLVNVNIPREPRGVLWTKVSVRQYDGRIVPIKDPQGREVYWYAVAPLSGAEEQTDRWAVEQNWISMTPLRIDLTDEPALTDLMSRRSLDWPAAAATSSPVSSPAAAEAVRKDEATAASEP